MPLPFGPARLTTERLLIASDGLLKYASQERIRAVAQAGPLEVAAKALIDAVRLRSVATGGTWASPALSWPSVTIITYAIGQPARMRRRGESF